MEQFMQFVQKSRSRIVITDSGAREDPFFYERQRQLRQTRDEIKNGAMKMYAEDEYQKESDAFWASFERQ
jgi:hypothetical protein